jgi:hypothetical protein
LQERKGRETELAQRRGQRKKASEPARALDAPAAGGGQLTFVDEGEAKQYLKDIKRELLYLFGFTPIPAPILSGPYYAKKGHARGEQRRLRDIHRSALIILRLYAYGKDYCFPSNKTLSKILCQKQDYTKKIVRDLDNDFALIARNERFNEDGSQTSNVTKLRRLDKGWVEDFNQKITGVAGKTTKIKEFHSKHEDHQSTYDSIGIDNLVLIHYAGVLSPSAFITLCLLIVLHKMRIYYFSGYDLANIRGVSKSKIYRDLDEIEATGLVEMIEKKRGTQRTILHKYPSLELILEYCKRDIKYVQALSKIIEDIPGHVLHQIFGDHSVDKIIDGLISASTSSVAVSVPYSAPPPNEYSDGVPYSAPPISSGRKRGVPYGAPGDKNARMGVPHSATPVSQIDPPMNNRYIEEPILNNVIEKETAATESVDNGTKNFQRRTAGKGYFKHEIPEAVVGEIREFVKEEICDFLDDHASLNNYVFLADLCYDNGKEYCEVIWRAKSLFKYERTAGAVKNEKRYFNSLLRKVMRDEYKIEIPRIRNS